MRHPPPASSIERGTVCINNAVLKSWQEGGGDNTDEPKAVSWGEGERHRFWVLECRGDHGHGVVGQKKTGH